jgi:putative ABC transport system permease protein
MTTMTRIVNNQRIQIGTLKALGFKSGVILRHYVSYGFFLALLGAAIGLIAGPISLPYLFYPSMSGFYTLPEWTPAYSSAFFIVAFVLIILCTAVSFIACYKLLRETPSETLRPRAPRIYRHNILERSGLWQKLGFNAQWNIRDTFRNRIRSIMAVIGVLGCTALIVCAFGMNNSMVDMKVWQYETIAQYESKLVLNEAATDKQIADVISAVNGEGIMESSVEIRANGEKKTGTLLVTDETTLLRQTDKRLNPASLPSDGVSVTQKMADMLGVMKGDAIEWHIYGAEDWHESKISEIYRDPINQGLTMTKQHFESLGAEFKMTSILSADTAGCYKTPSLRGASATKQSKDVAITGLLRSARNNVLLKLEFLHSLTVRENYAGVDSVEFTTDSISGWDDLTEALYTMIYLLIAAATVLSVVVLYNLGLLSFTEMERSMATLKVMGLKTRRLRNLLLTQNLWFSAVGFILGIPAGLWLIKIICSYSGESFDFPISLHTLTLAIAFVFTFGLSVLVNLMFSRKIRRLNMVESLKAME